MQWSFNLFNMMCDLSACSGFAGRGQTSGNTGRSLKNRLDRLWQVKNIDNMPVNLNHAISMWKLF